MWKKNFRIRKVQTFMLFTVVLLCTTLLNASICILTSLDEPYEELVEECHAAEALMYPNTQDEERVKYLKDELLKLDEIHAVEINKRMDSCDELYHKGDKLEGFSFLTYYNEVIYKKVRIKEKSNGELSHLKPNECYVPICVANANEIELGDTIDVTVNNQEYRYTVVGIYTEPYSTTTAFGSSILVSYIPDQAILTNELYLYFQPDVTAQQVEDAYRYAHDGEMEGRIKSLNDIIADGLSVGQITGAVFLAIGVIMLIVSGLIIQFMVRNNMHQDAKTISVYKAMGYEHSTILSIYLTFYCVVTVTGCVAGVVLSKWVSNLILMKIYNNIGAIASVNPFKAGIWCIFSISIFVLLITGTIVNRTKKVKPAFVLQGMNSKNTQKRKNPSSMKFQFSPFGLAIRRMMKNKKGILGILITAITTVYAVNFAIITLDIAKNQKNQNDYWLGIDPCDVVVKASALDNMDDIDKLLSKEDAIDYTVSCSLTETKVTLPWEPGKDNSMMYGFVYDSFESVALPVTQGRNPREANEIAISSKIADEQNKHVGDYITVKLYGQKEVTVLIVGLYQSYYAMGDSCRLLAKTLKEADLPINLLYRSVYLKNPDNTDRFINRLEDEMGSKAIVTKRTEMFPSIMSMIVTPQENAIPALIVLVCIIGGVNIFSIVMLKNKETQRENGIFKSIGYTTGHLMWTNLIYVMMIAVASCIIALPINLATYEKIMTISLSMFGFHSYPMTFQPIHLLLVNSMILTLFVVCTLLSSRSLRRLHVKELVYE